MPNPTNPEQILVVDDSPTNLRLLTQILSGHGYRVRAVAGGRRALESAELTTPDLILLDIRMPELDGYAVCERLKQNPQTAEIPILFISALDDVADKLRAFAAGGQDYITKPFQAEEVVARVSTHLALRRLQRTLQDANRQMAAELALAAQVQTSFMQRPLPRLPGWQLAVTLLPARLTSGDFYDVVDLPDGEVGLLVADVADKGVGAALYMAMSCALLRSAGAEHPRRPEQVCRQVNERLIAYTTADHFVTVFMAVLDPSSGSLRYSNGGHNPGLLLRAAGADWLWQTGPPLGILAGGIWQSAALVLEPGDRLVLMTDGVTDAENAAGERFGLARLQAAAAAVQGQSAEVCLEAILTAVHTFTGGLPQTDDLALLVLGRTSQ